MDSSALLYTLYVILLLNIIALYVIIRYEAFKGNVVNVPNMHIGYICTVYIYALVETGE